MPSAPTPPAVSDVLGPPPKPPTVPSAEDVLGPPPRPPRIGGRGHTFGKIAGMGHGGRSNGPPSPPRLGHRVQSDDNRAAAGRPIVIQQGAPTARKPLHKAIASESEDDEETGQTVYRPPRGMGRKPPRPRGSRRQQAYDTAQPFSHHHEAPETETETASPPPLDDLDAVEFTAQQARKQANERDAAERENPHATSGKFTSDEDYQDWLHERGKYARGMPGPNGPPPAGRHGEAARNAFEAVKRKKQRQPKPTKKQQQANDAEDARTAREALELEEQLKKTKRQP